jgi:hypothetical protein
MKIRTSWNKGTKGVMIAWNKGKKCPNISSSKLGHTVSGETRKKLSIANTGSIVPEERRKKISIGLTGFKRSKEEIEKSRIKRTGLKRTDTQRKNISKGNVGRKLSEEAKKNIGLGHIGLKYSRESVEKSRIKRRGVKRTDEQRRNISKGHLGNKSNLWQGGVTPDDKKIRIGIEYRLWRESVLVRDNWTCQKCKIKSGCGHRVYFCAHHIQNFSQVKELRTSIENGITFCKECHKKFHKIYGRKNNSQDQVNKFLLYEI